MYQENQTQPILVAASPTYAQVLALCKEALAKCTPEALSAVRQIQQKVLLGKVPLASAAVSLRRYIPTPPPVVVVVPMCARTGCTEHPSARSRFCSPNCRKSQRRPKLTP